MKKPVVIEVLSHRRAKVVDPSEALSEVLDRELSFQATEERFARMHNGAWDGRKRFYHAMSGSFALGLLRRVKNLITDLGLKVTVRDLREQKPPQPDMSLVHPDMLEGVSMSGMYAMQFDGLKKVLKRGGGMVRAATNCVAGDTIIGVNRNGASFSVPIEKFVKMFNNPERRTVLKVRMRQKDGYIRLAPVSAAYESGIKTTYVVTTSSGFNVKATRKHRFLTLRGYVRLRDLQIGDRVYVDGGRTKIERAVRIYKALGGMDFHPYRAIHRDKRPGRRDYFSVQTHRLVAEARLNNMSLEKFLRRVRRGKIEGLVFVNPKKWTAHHINSDVQDNSPENIELVGRRKHCVRHGKILWRNATARTVLDDVISISRYGKEMTYDLSVADDQHNFLANGIVVHNSGKSTIAAAVVKAYLPNIRGGVVLVHKQKLLKDHRRDLAAFLGTIEQNIGQIGSGIWEPKKITVAMVDSLLLRADAKKNHKRIREFLKSQDLLIQDEAHHCAAKKWARVLQRCNAPVRIGLSGSYVPGGASLGIEAQLGPIVFRTTNAQLTSLGISAKLTVKLREVEEPEDLEGAWRDVYQQGIVDNVQRNVQIADDTLDAFSKKLPVVVMVREKRHGRNLSELLRARKVPHKFLYSTGFPGGLKAIEGFLAAFEKGILPVLLTTTGLFDEGANLPAIRRLIMGDGLKSLRLVLQKCGRALRRKKGQDNTVEVYDYMDVFNEWLAGHSLERLNIYEKEGFEVIEL
jgi:hypothetical protein